MHRFAAGIPSSKKGEKELLGKEKTYRLYYTKEGKTDKLNITISSYARDIANEVFIRLSDEEFMTKVHERMALEEKEKMESKTENPSPMRNVEENVDKSNETINVLTMGNAAHMPSIGAT